MIKEILGVLLATAICGATPIENNDNIKSENRLGLRAYEENESYLLYTFDTDVLNNVRFLNLYETIHDYDIALEYDGASGPTMQYSNYIENVVLGGGYRVRLYNTGLWYYEGVVNGETTFTQATFTKPINLYYRYHSQETVYTADNLLSVIRQDLEDNNTVIKQTFTFNKDFNYNALVQRDNITLSTIGVRYKYPFVEGLGLDQLENNIYLDTPFFVSNGILFNQIVTYTRMASTDLKFYDANGEIVQTRLIDNHNPFTFFYSMSFKNTYNGLTVKVYQRDVVHNQDDTFILYNGTWVSPEYQHLNFLETLESTWLEYNILTMANNNYDMTGFGNNVSFGSSSMGLGSAFSLLSMAFASVTSLLTVQVIPGLSLGLLLFLPLIVGIIILVIWIVKR